MADEVTCEMPRYRCHKEVWAIKIAEVHHNGMIVPADEGYGVFQAPDGYLEKHDPQPGGYYVLYHDGYASFSPAAAFEAGYTRI